MVSKVAGSSSVTWSNMKRTKPQYNLLPIDQPTYIFPYQPPNKNIHKARREERPFPQLPFTTPNPNSLPFLSPHHLNPPNKKSPQSPKTTSSPSTYIHSHTKVGYQHHSLKPYLSIHPARLFH